MRESEIKTIVSQGEGLREDIFKIIVPLTPLTMQATMQATVQATVQATAQVTPQVTPQATPQAENDKISKIRAFCIEPKTREEIQQFLGLKDREHFRLEILKPLIKNKMLLLTIPDKPNSPKQKYYSKIIKEKS